jgi:homopolymeric O-antigen transport system ATP-binding protein
MSNLAIRVENLGKMYRLGQRPSYKALPSRLVHAARRPADMVQSWLQGTGKPQRLDKNTFWALKHASFEVRRGEVVGLIGRNGAGKSTLLKILSRITEPTQGYVEGYGRVSSLLEVGTGFHPELTGRENIYLNATMLGMRRAEIERKFPDIVAFAEIERFLDTPVKHYSSGMYVRLAFAVAAQLEPEILLVDEVLAVGDMAFQKKCLHNLEQVGQGGRTVFFVSHSMEAITRLCTRAILLDAGTVVADGLPSQVVSAYLSTATQNTAERIWPDPASAPQGKVARLHAVRVRSTDGRISNTVDIRRPLRVEMEYDVLQDGHLLMPSFPFTTETGLRIFSAHDLDPAWRQRPRPRGHYISSALVPGNLLAEGMVHVGAGVEALDSAYVQFYEPDVVTFQVIDSLDGDSARGDYVGEMHGIVRPMLQWSTQFTPHAVHPTTALPAARLASDAL